MKQWKYLYLASLLIIVMVVVSCSKKAPGASLLAIGTWRGVLDSTGGELPFGLVIEKQTGGLLKAHVRNGPEILPFSHVEQANHKIKMIFYHYDSFIEAEIQPDGQKENFPAPISGEWEVEFMDSLGKSPAKAVFSQKGTKLTGTFLTPLGDYRFLEGAYQKGMLQLSVFDGAHAFLFRAQVDENGSFHGDFWSRYTYHATWTAVKGETDMPDPFTLTRLTNNEKRFSFNFPDVDRN